MDMTIKELYYINKWKPKYNIKDKQDGDMALEIVESADVWENYLILKPDYKTQYFQMRDSVDVLKDSYEGEIAVLRELISKQHKPAKVVIDLDASKSFSYENALYILSVNEGFRFVASTMDRRFQTVQKSILLYAKEGKI